MNHSLFRKRPFCLGLALTVFCAAVVAPFPLHAQPKYESYRVEKVPCTIHVVKVPRKDRRFELRSVHADGKAVGLANVTAQAKLFRGDDVKPLAGVNGDFYERRGPYAGDSRGLQVVEGELISAPTGGASFWIDAADQPNVGETVSLFKVVWPDGSSAPMELNSARGNSEVVLYTPAMGRTTHASGGTELVLERDGTNGPPVAWLPLRPGRVYQARVREVRQGGNSRIDADTVVLSMGSRVRAPRLEAGAQVRFTTDTRPLLRGVSEALSGGPVLVKDGKRQRIKVPEGDSYMYSSMTERHPRSAIGWNEEFYFLVSVDGRHGRKSVGLTLAEFARELENLGCEQAMNLDGGGSATLWFQGRARNYLCDGFERDIANSLMVVEKKTAPANEVRATISN